MRERLSMVSRVSAVGVPCLIFLCFFPGSVLSAVVTLKSIELYNTYGLMPRKPTIYFQCSGENKTILPDVQEINTLYDFEGEESWQPLTELVVKKCKKCGIYEKLVVSDHVFDEWELCPSDFAAPDAAYTRIKENEFKAAFLCKECLSLPKDPPSSKNSDEGEKKHYFVPIFLSILAIVAVGVISYAAYKRWQKKKRQQDQARFLKLFEDDDDMERELGLSEM